jgi:GntR family transcriptional regulator
MSRALDPSSGLPLYLQVAAVLREQIASGELPSGAAAPSLRSTASDLRVNVHTVAKSYQLLEREGLLERQRGEPYRVAETGQLGLEMLRAEVQELVARAEALGVSAAALRDLVDEVVREGGRMRA